MLFLWHLYLLLSLLSSPLSLHVTAITKETVTETEHPDTDKAVHHLTQSLTHGFGSAENPSMGDESVDFLGQPLSWSLSSSEESDRQGVIGEYTDLQEGTEISLLYSNEKELFISRPTDGATEDAALKESTQPVWSPLKYVPAETSTGSIFHSSQAGKNQSTFSSSDSQLPFLLSGSLPLDQGFTSPPAARPRPSPERLTPLEWTTSPSAVALGQTQEGTVPSKEAEAGLIDVTEQNLQRGAVRTETDKDDLKDDVSQVAGTVSLGTTDTTATPCKTSNQSLTPTYPEDFISSESLRTSLALTSALFVPLYSDWNSALATWGFAWEAHIYGLGAVFTGFGLISVVCLLGLPLRCPPGSPFFTLLHLFLLSFAGIQAFCLLYDAYNHQDRLPPMVSLLLSELLFPCLISAFSLAFFLLSFRSRKHLSLPLANSTSFSILPKPSLLLCMTLLHIIVSLGCVGMLELFHSLPSVILLFPQGVFVCLSIFLSFYYLIFFCLIQVNTKHIYRLNDNVESGGSPEVMHPASAPFAKEEDWGRAAGAGLGASLCLLGCGGFQLYGILHGLGLGAVSGYGFQPWPWWGFQVGCRICEIGVCLGLSLIGTHPLFCQNNSSIKTMTHPRPGSWSRLSCSSPSRRLTLPSDRDADSPVLSPNESWSQSKQDNLVVCDVITKGKPETLPLFSMVDPPGNGLDCVPKSNQIRNTVLPLPTPPSPPHKPKPAAESQISSLDSLRLDTDSTVDLRPPSPINLSRSIDQALFSESLFSHSIFDTPRLFNASSSHSLSSPSQGKPNQGPSSMENALYRTSSCGDVDQENLSLSRPSQSHGTHSKSPVSPEQWDWKGSISGSTQGLCNHPKETGKLRSHSWANRGQNFAQSSLPRAIPHLSYHRRYRTLSLASQDSQGSGRLAGTKQLSESKQLEWDMTVQAEFVNVCRQIDALSVCSDTIDL
ncbi:proline-rich transmembrane protein 4 [Notolabrus celidotus]|uniref:proline-rich transmembrane protein 4 n=1 Tax=Notolabrus celidotus TaxID=1203425 RepID=UPI00148FE033|nr:proline-rich transmembrane protein 4 [Notolabrus celidotus]XP_034540741.1 proline-rich transmembrane protein 4 [Notolabrus celidotus]XP_034540742.1 proline-rich transmembrane protein 4 [Notolabrus celidotus]